MNEEITREIREKVLIDFMEWYESEIDYLPVEPAELLLSYEQSINDTSGF